MIFLLPLDFLIQLVFNAIPIKYADSCMFVAKILVWPDSDIFIVWVAAIIVVFSAQEPISSI